MIFSQQFGLVNPFMEPVKFGVRTFATFGLNFHSVCCLCDVPCVLGYGQSRWRQNVKNGKI